jgi:hypothetical protein
MMVAVAVVAIACGICALKQRREYFLERSAYHSWRSERPMVGTLPLEITDTYHRTKLRRTNYHREMKAKYERAALFPFLSVEADPPEP